MARRRLLKDFYAIYGGERYDGTFTVPSFPATGGSASFVINSTTPWELVSKPNWIAMSVSSGGMGVTVVNITADTNPTTTVRAGEIRIKTKNGWGQEIVANCKVEANTAWITVDGSSESPQTKEINWNATSTSFNIASNGGWKVTKDGTWQGYFNPTGNTASTPGEAVSLNNIGTNSSSGVLKTISFIVESSADTTQTITVNGVQNRKPNAIFEKVGTNIGNNVYALPYTGQNSAVTISANTTFNITGETPSTNYVTMETPINGVDIYTKDVSYSAQTLNSGQTELSAYNYTLSAISSDNSGYTPVVFSYEPYPYIPDVSAITVSSADTSGVTSALSNYWLDVIDVKQYPNLFGKSIIDKPYSAWTSGNVEYNVNTGHTWPIVSGLSSSSNSETYGAEFFNTGYVFYNFNIGEIEQDIPLVKFDCTTQGCFRGGSSPQYVNVRYCLCSGTTPIGDEIRFTGNTTSIRYYNVITGICSVAAGVPDIRLRINCVKCEPSSGVFDPSRFGFFGATLGINCYGTPPVSSNRLSAWTVHYANNVPLKPSILNYEFKTGPSESDELYDIEVVAHSARTMNNNTVLEMLGPGISGNVLTIARGAYGIRSYLSLSGASPSIPYTGNTEIAAYFDDGEAGIVTNVTSASTWSVITGGEYGGIYTGGTPSAVRYFVSGNNYDNVNHTVGFKAVYEKDQKSYEAGGSVIVKPRQN